MNTVKADRKMSHPANYKKFQTQPAKFCASQPALNPLPCADKIVLKVY